MLARSEPKPGTGASWTGQRVNKCGAPGRRMARRRPSDRPIRTSKNKCSHPPPPFSSYCPHTLSPLDEFTDPRDHTTTICRHRVSDLFGLYMATARQTANHDGKTANVIEPPPGGVARRPNRIFCSPSSVSYTHLTLPTTPYV